MEFKCDLCGAGFYYKRYLTSHLSRTHKLKNNEKNTLNSIGCKYCGKLFASKNSLSHHVRKIHQVIRATVVCQEENCTEKFTTVRELRTHLYSIHQMKDIEDCEKLKFEKYSDFQQWLAEEENRSNVKFLIQFKRKNEGDKSTYFRCNRSGVYKPKVECRQRKLKAQGTMKLGFHCTAAILVKNFNAYFEVSYYKVHYKHENSFCHVPLPKVEKQLIAGKLLQGVSTKNILQDIRQSSDTSEIKRKHLITRKDLYNIKRDFGINLPNKGSTYQKDEKVESLKLMISVITSQLHSIATMDDDVSKQINYHLVAIANLLRTKCATLKSTNKVIKQKRFYSVKKPLSNSNKKFKISNPNSAEIKT